MFLLFKFDFLYNFIIKLIWTIHNLGKDNHWLYMDRRLVQ